MNLSKSMATLILIGSILFLVCAQRSWAAEDSGIGKPSTRHKRWTFNTWRLHGRRQLPAIPPTDPYAMGTSSSFLLADHPFGSNEDGDAETIGERLLRVLQALSHKQQENNERDNRF